MVPLINSCSKKKKGSGASVTFFQFTPLEDQLFLENDNGLGVSLNSISHQEQATEGTSVNKNYSPSSQELNEIGYGTGS